MRASLLAAVAILAASCSVASATNAPITIVAAENFYGNLAQRIAGPEATVTSILSNPDQDPHLFESDASTARALTDAKIVISNGADYDPWMEKLLSASKAKDRIEIVAADLVGKKPGDNPHLWYDPATMKAVANRLADDLGKVDPAHKAEFDRRAESFVAGLKPLKAKMAEIKARFGGQPVTASEPVFGYMADALGLDMKNKAFQLAVMNNTEPSPADVAAFEDDLKGHKIKAMLYNSQADDQAVKRLVGIAKEAHVPVVGVSETEPAGKTYEAWMLDQLTDLEKALASPKP
ncbi:metal ABC transporter solute-binding protein, Zn/Mn family [Lichenihabitans psoromatis]|uniref:metal ABC transporter solute-binding protein, Zn/Mn family n=1 Tax=Lichenihabitans psoromatis TaxID=2528642 RepID=UPI0010383F11|nr:zinc ABC transporter substrate-binding protein [Lichenihabitans psoromatis]